MQVWACFTNDIPRAQATRSIYISEIWYVVKQKLAYLASKPLVRLTMESKGNVRQNRTPNKSYKNK